ncbi:type IV pilus twitching motility protein PilT [Campylobacter suis]|uniref:Twitching mobility protein n=1 Tax=Campylobacter suis TaxID=2790657 RepID=A0ABM8Q6Z7_9BACT|nr:PilT/PilU family type 4a pilus ATPase [Campylobacter suis]CAD7288567.1 Twitching mobility protein [Campylobacter suis]
MQENLLFEKFISKEASDLHLVANSPAFLRIDSNLVALDDKNLCDEELHEFCFSLLNESQKCEFMSKKELDFSFGYKNFRFRANFYLVNESKMAANFRKIPVKIPTLSSLNSPDILRHMVRRQKGLILVTGATGSGKSTTMAAMLNEINETQAKHILTIEDPVEFIHTNKKSLFSHRNLGSDTTSYANALKQALRQDPDVILVGELRDADSMAAAISAAETGHLVLATLHTNSAISSINRILDSFVGAEQALIQSMLSGSLLAVISQNLVPKISGARLCVHEILINNQAISNLIREGKTHQIYSQMQLGQSSGMQTQAFALTKAVNSGLITQQSALEYANNTQEILNLNVGM